MKILNVIIKPCLKADENFMLIKNRDEIHDTNASVNEMIRKCKKNNDLRTYFNALNSPDFNVIETCTNSIKQHLYKQAIIDEETLKKYMLKA